jgi:nickel-type superoxide dismutase maturation protease
LIEEKTAWYHLILRRHFMYKELRIAGWRERFLGLVGWRRTILVDGESMLPVLSSGDRVLIDPKAEIAVGDIVVAKHPFKKSVRMIKRVSAIDSNANYVLTGDNPTESSDSRSLGSFPASEILGKVVSKTK